MPRKEHNQGIFGFPLTISQMNIRALRPARYERLSSTVKSTLLLRGLLATLDSLSTVIRSYLYINLVATTTWRKCGDADDALRSGFICFEIRTVSSSTCCDTPFPFVSIRLPQQQWKKLGNADDTRRSDFIFFEIRNVLRSSSEHLRYG